MSDLRKAAQQALEAMEYAGMDVGKFNRVNAACTALRAALAQEQPAPEPVAEMPSNTRFTVHVEGFGNTYYDNIHDAMTYAQRSVYASVDATTQAIADLKAGRIAEWTYGFSAVRIYPPQKIVEQPAPEPVAWMYTGIKHDGTEHGPHLVWKPAYMDAMSAEKGAKAMPLYAAPPQRPPLTDEEIAVIEESCMGTVQYGGHENMTQERVFDVLAFARAIERKVRGEA